jgi:hypothetical protein
MAFVQDDHVVQAFTPNTPNQPLDIRILPRTPGGDYDLFDPHMLYPLPKGSAIDAVPIAQEIPRGLVPREGLNDLLGGPRGRGMLGDVEVDDVTSIVEQDDQDKEHRVPHGGDHQEIQGHQVRPVSREKGLPVGDGGLGGRLRYVSTVDLVTSMPTFRRAPTIRGEPRVGFACPMSRISWRTCLVRAGRPGLPR